MHAPAESTLHFYTCLPGFANFAGIADVGNFHEAPDDWIAVIADIKGSTDAIARGRYKDVNVIGAACVAAVVNALEGVEIPYVFGGDGAAFLVPGARREATAVALAGASRMARDSFGMDLRVGAVPIRTLREHGAQIRVAKLVLAEDLSIGVFAGDGIQRAEQLIKSPDASPAYALEPETSAPADFRGLECRWEPIRSRKGEIVSLIVLAAWKSLQENAALFARVLHVIREIYGAAEDYNPVTAAQLHLALSREMLRPEVAVRTYDAGLASQFLYALSARIQCLAGRAIFKLGLNAGVIDGRDYLEQLPRHTDFQKFDGALRMTMDGSPAQRKALMAWLEAELKAGRLCYGMSVADSALMTCLVFDRRNRHLHFVDGAAGGYAVAARQLKDRLAQVRR